MSSAMSLNRRAILSLLAALCASTALAQPAPPTTREPYMDQIRDALHARSAAFRQCFERALRLDPALVARTEAMRFRVLPSGRVRAISVRVVPRSASLERCMTGVLERMVLPPHPGGPIEVSYPMTE
jgi:hypothetical protein